MIEITYLELFSYATPILGASFILGYKIGIGNSVSTSETFCDTPRDFGFTKSIRVKKISLNAKCKDINCVYIQEKRKCKFTDKKCKFIF